MLEGARRKAAEFREPVKKAGEVKLETLQNMVARFIMAYQDNIAEAHIYRQRTITRLVVTYFTFCRLSDFRQLQARHIEDKGDILEIVFPTQKNDQGFLISTLLGYQNEFCVFCNQKALFSPNNAKKRYWSLSFKLGHVTYQNIRIKSRIPNIHFTWQSK